MSDSTAMMRLFIERCRTSDASFSLSATQPQCGCYGLRPRSTRSEKPVHSKKVLKYDEVDEVEKLEALEVGS